MPSPLLRVVAIGALLLFCSGCWGTEEDLNEGSNGVNSNQNQGGSDEGASCEGGCAYDEFCVDGTCEAPTFVVEDIEQSNWFGAHLGILVDAEHNPHIAYYWGDTLRYRWINDQGDWSSESITTLESNPSWVSLFFDDEERLHLTYVEEGRLSHAIRQDDGWDVNPQFTTGMGISGYITDHSMVVDGLGVLHAVIGTNQTTIYHLAHHQGQWSHQLLSDRMDASAPRHPHLTLGVDERLHMTFTSHDSDSLYHAHYDQQWSDEPIIADYRVVSRHRIAVDPEGGIHVAMIDQQRDELFYGTRGAEESASWSVESVDRGENLNRTIAFAVGPDGRPHIVYYDYDFEDRTEIRYARKTGDEWFITTVDDAQITQGAHIALDVDGRGVPHLVYSDGGPTLRYTTLD